MTTERASPAGEKEAVIARGLFAIGLLLPLLAGGNVLLALEPQLAIALFDVTTIGLAGLVLSGGTSRTRGLEHRSTWIADASLLALCTWWIGALLLRPFGPRALLEAQGMFCAVILFACFSRHSFDADSLDALVRGLVAGAVLTTAYGQYQYWIAFPRTAPLLQARGIPTVPFVNANFYNANCYAVFLAATILLAGGLAVMRQDRLAGIGILPLMVTLLLTRSRATVTLLVAFGLALAWLTADDRRRSFVKAARPWLLIAAAAGAAIAVVTIHPLELWRVGLLGRIAIWQGSLAMVRDHWLAGVGLGRFWDYFVEYRVNAYYTRYPHSFLLEIFAELGIVGLIAILAFLAAAFVRPVSALREATRHGAGAPPLGVAVGLACGLLVVHALVDIDWHAPANPILLLALLGVSQSVATALSLPRSPGAPL